MLTGPPGTIHACKRVVPEEVYVSVGLRADLAIFLDSLQRELPDVLCEERSGFMPGRFIFYFALAVDSFPRITVTDAFGRLNNVPAAAVIVDRAGVPAVPLSGEEFANKDSELLACDLECRLAGQPS